jgi:septum formation protein
MPDRRARRVAPQVDAVILASASPRRSELLAQAGVRFEVEPADIAEESRQGEGAEELAERLAREKALAVARRLGPAPARLVLAADTVVAVGDLVLGKPASPAHAVELLQQLVGRAHRVVTGVAVANSATLALRSTRVASRVWMRDASEAELRAYVATGEPLDKAGAYGFQGEGRRFVLRVEGSETNVIGLPVEEALALLAAARAA